MKFPVPTTLVLIASASLVLAQDPVAPPPGTPATPPAAGAKPKALSASDKSFVKKSLEGLFFLTRLTDRGKRDKLKNEEGKKLASTINGDTNKIYGELGALFSDPKELPTEVSGGDKSKLGRLDKTEGDKYDKEFFELVGKEMKQLAKSVETASKSSQNDVIKQIATTWLSVLQGKADEAEMAEKAAAKAK